MDYKNMSDGEISWLVHHKVRQIPKGHATICVEDYCNNPSDAWPIMNSCSIEIKRDTCQAHVSSYFNPEFIVHCRNDEKEILRAAMICFLKFKEIGEEE